MSTEGAGSKSIDAKSALIRGAAWGVGMRWSIKFLGLISTLVLARILTPKDYGLVAMATLVVALIEVFIDFGVETGLVRMHQATREDVDSAWTLRVLQSCMLSALLACLAPFAGEYFREPRVVPIVWIIAGSSFIAGCANIGIVLARKNLDFGLEFRFNVVVKLASTAITIVAAFILRDYRALVLGLVAGHIGSCVMSYVMHPYRARWCTARLGTMWSFGKWMLVSGIGNFATRRVDEIIAGRVADAHGLGIYNVGADIGQMPTAEIGPPMTRAILPTLSSIQDDPERVRSGVFKTMSAINTVTIAAGAGLACVATPVTAVLLGDKWMDAAPILGLFAVIGAVKMSVAPLPSLMLLRGHAQVYARIMWLEFAAFAAAALLMVPAFGIMGLAYAKLVSASCNWGCYMIAAHVCADISVGRLLRRLMRPIVGTALMVGVIGLVDLSAYADVIQLAGKISVGAAVYGAWILTTWVMVGKPDGIEAVLMQFLNRRILRRTST